MLTTIQSCIDKHTQHARMHATIITKFNSIQYMVIVFTFQLIMPHPAQLGCVLYPYRSLARVTKSACDSEYINS